MFYQKDLKNFAKFIQKHLHRSLRNLQVSTPHSTDFGLGVSLLMFALHDIFKDIFEWRIVSDLFILLSWRMCNFTNDNRILFFKIKIGSFSIFTEWYSEPCKTSKMVYCDRWLMAISCYYFLEMFHLRWLAGFWICLYITIFDNHCQH